MLRGSIGRCADTCCIVRGPTPSEDASRSRRLASRAHVHRQPAIQNITKRSTGRCQPAAQRGGALTDVRVADFIPEKVLIQRPHAQRFRLESCVVATAAGEGQRPQRLPSLPPTCQSRVSPPAHGGATDASRRTSLRIARAWRVFFVAEVELCLAAPMYQIDETLGERQRAERRAVSAK